MNKLFARIFAAILLLQFIYSEKSFSQDLFVIANIGLGNPKVNKEEIRDLYLHNRSIKNIDMALIPIDGPNDQGIKDIFYKRIANFTRIDLKRHWSRAVFTGKGIPPMTISREDLIESTIAENPSYIGYISRPPSHPKVKVLLQIE